LCSKGEIRGCFQCATGAGEPVEEDRIGWETVLEEFQPNVAADKGFLHEGHRPYASADYFHHPVGPASSPRIPPENGTSHRTVPGRGTRVQEQLLSGKVLQRLSFCSPPSWLFSFTWIYVIRPGVTSPETTCSLAPGNFLLSLSLFIIIFFTPGLTLTNLRLFLGRVEGRKDPEDFPRIRTA
jgi:hypothetical protein